MADVDRMVRVSGLPTYIEDDRLSDKLLILFLREKNGGGEIVSLTIVKDPPGSALITFEDGRVARRVIRHAQHILELEGTQYELTLTPHYERLEPDMVVLSMSVIIDCKKVPLRRSTRNILLKNNPEIKFKEHTSERTWEITGPYSQVQTALEQLLRLPRCHKSEDKSSSDNQASSGGPDINAFEGSPTPEKQLPKLYNSSVYKEQSLEQFLRHPRSPKSEDKSSTDDQASSCGPDINAFQGSPTPETQLPIPYNSIVNNEQSMQQFRRHPRPPKSEDKSTTDYRANSGGPDINVFQSVPPQETQVTKPYDSSVYTEQSYQEHHVGNHPATPRGQPKSCPVREDMDQTEAGAMQLPKDPQLLDEDLTLVMDADMFQYLKKHCGTEYQRIIGQNSVEVLDVTSEGVTTMYLHCERNLGETDNCLQRLRSARNQISQLYQDEEMTICRVHLLKSTLPPAGVLRRSIEELAATHPRLLLNEDDRNIYLIGSYIDTSEAKKMLWGFNEPRAVHDQIFVGLPRSHSLDLNSENSPEDPLVVHRPRPDSPRIKRDTLHRPDRVECRAEGTTKYKLAAQFPNSETGGFESLQADLTGAGSSRPPPAMRTALSPLLGSDGLAGSARFTESSLPKQRTREDVLFESGARPSQSSASGDSRLLTFPESHPFPTQICRSGGVPRPALGTGLSSNFDRPLDEGDHPRPANRVRRRTHSLSNLTEKQISDMCCVQITVPSMIWKYIKEVYQPKFVEVTRAIKMEEMHIDSRGVTIVLLTAFDRSRVETCQTDIQNIVAKVNVDFSQRHMWLTELGVSNPSDETLQEFIAEVRHRFKKVSIQISNGLISILGPEYLCSQVTTALTEWLSSGSAQKPGQLKLFLTEASALAYFFHSETTEHKQETNPLSAGEHADYVPNSDVVDVSLRPNPPLAQKETDIRHKGGRAGTMQPRRWSTVSQTHATVDSSANLLNHSWQQAIDPRQNTSPLQTENTPLLTVLQNDNGRYESTKSQPCAGASSPCSDSGMSGLQRVKDRCHYCSTVESLTTEKCGPTMCPDCQVKHHAHCRLCPKRTQCKGIKGSMRYSDLSLTLQGHSKEATIKITYTIPDGIQGENHPHPGLPFKGGFFVAYLPCNDKAKRLLNRLDEAFKLGHTFTIQRKGEVDSVAWDCIPHKTSIQGGKSQNGYPDVTFLTRLSDILSSYGV